MKNIKKIFVLLLLLVLVPLGVFAETSAEGNPEATTTPINIYLFRGDGCPHCADLEDFFASIEKEYGQYYNLVDYEVWYNKDNSDLMKEIAEKMGDEVSGVPYLIIGKKTWNGYENVDSLNKEITDAIMDEYYSDSRFDVFADDNKKNNTGAIILVICIVAAGVGLLYLSRKTTENVNDVVSEEVEEVKVEKVEEKKVEKKEEKTEEPKKSSKKKSTKKKSNKKK